MIWDLFWLIALIAVGIWCVDLLPFPPPAKLIIRALLALIGLAWVFRAMGVFGGAGHTLR